MPPRARRAPVLPALGLTLGLLGLVVSAVPADATARQDQWSVPAQATITLTGHGYGHGHGMSQYGAEGAARQGLTAQQIVAFYYPGSTAGTTGGQVSVQISADTTDDLEVLARRGLSLRDLSSREKVLLREGPSRWRLVTSNRNVTRLEALSGGVWTKERRLSGEGQFSAKGPITLVTPSGNRAYRGRLRAAVVKPGSPARDTVNVLSLEKYLRGVVPREMPPSWSPEAVRAQAIAARTYAAYERAHPRAGHYQICDTTSCQVYGGVGSEVTAATEALQATRGQVLVDSTGEPAFTQFSSSSGGWSAAGSVPYLASQADPYDGWDGNPNHDWTRTLRDDAIERGWPSIGDLQEIRVAGRDGGGDWGGRVTSLRLVGSQRSLTVSGDTVRAVLGLRSTYFTFAVAPGR